MRTTDVLVIGGSAAGATAAVTARRHYPEKQVLLVRKEEQVPVPCGIPYIFGTLGDPSKNIMPDTLLKNENVTIAIEEALAIDTKAKRVETDRGLIAYDRLVVATGSLPGRLPVPGFELEGAFPILKDVAHLACLQERLQTAKNIVVIGCGFIGIEFADEINKLKNKKVTVLEVAPYCLSLAYDEEFCVEMQNLIAERGVDVRTNARVAAIEGESRVTSVKLADGEILPADLVIFGVGAVPNTELAAKAGLALCPSRAVAVDRAMRTSVPDVFACGDCVEKYSFFGGRPSHLRLASIATLEARIAGANLYSVRREHHGTVGVWSTAIDNLAMGTAGLTEGVAREKGYDCLAVTIEGPNRHPGSMPGGALTRLKLVFEKNTGILLGGQVRGNAAAGEMINIVSACIQKRMTAEDIATFQIGTHPALTASPVTYHLLNAAEKAIAQLRSN